MNRRNFNHIAKCTTSDDIDHLEENEYRSMIDQEKMDAFFLLRNQLQ